MYEKGKNIYILINLNGKYFRQKLYRCTTRKQLQRLRDEIQITCKYNNIEIPLNIRRSKYHHYIEHLSKMIDTSNAKKSSFLLSNFRTLLINEDYKAMINNSETDEMTKKIIQQTLKFEEELFNLFQTMLHLPSTTIKYENKQRSVY
jgi:hypothetical protein